MMLSRNYASLKRSGGAVLALLLLLGVAPQTTFAQTRFAVVPTSTIYPGEEITGGRVTEVEVTNPNLAGGYASDTDQVLGKVSKRTLVAGRTIPVSSLRDPYAVVRGAVLQMKVSAGNVVISASGVSLADAMVGDVVRVRNQDTGVIISGTVLADGTVEVLKQ